MSGHSKWATTKRHKAVVDAKRGKIFSVLGKEITLAAKAGGGDLDMNARLRTVVDKAKMFNMPAENVKRAIQKGTGEIQGAEIVELLYEGYAPGGVGLIVEVTTDNKNRAASDVRSTFVKNGGTLAAQGALMFNFKRSGQFIIDSSKISEDALMELVLDAGADDIKNYKEYYEVLTSISAYDSVARVLNEKNIETQSSELAYIPNTNVEITDNEVAERILRLVSKLEEIEDVKNVFGNFDIDDNIELDSET